MLATNTVHLERVRLIPPEGPTIDHIARRAPQWRHHHSFWQGGVRFDIWINWDDRVQVEHNGEVILKMWAPAGEIFRAIEDRRKVNG